MNFEVQMSPHGKNNSMTLIRPAQKFSRNDMVQNISMVDISARKYRNAELVSLFEHTSHKHGDFIGITIHSVTTVAIFASQPLKSIL